ncbi:hypothetical protein EZJ43_08305 [Pedobacter changchengzhani]|uniref:Uncharacterized protein n=1 Tax=Pedobacter changchengzhani TaxID=2529274 RepID=A0A4R5MLJ6_9SPHI|nr:SIR2 family protein [Pedobacter changchengzhani]TDG36508.1 hypothetical protein EZJ43_08305 [Pedobacter changchengzhani]
MNFGSDKMLISRINAGFKQKKQFTFLLGSGCTLSNGAGSRGVSSVSEVISLIKGQFEADGQLDILEDALMIENKESNPYQIAMNTLLQCYGQDDVNKVIITAVLNARNNSIVHSENQNDSLILEDIEKDLTGWILQDGIIALGKILVQYPRIFKSPVLTTNFDPLIEISVAKNNGTYAPTSMTNDGNILNVVSSPSVQIVHLHGYWRQGDTMHSSIQLTKERTLLKGDLRKLLQNSILVIIGYGGWGDVFTNTLIDVVNEGNSESNVLWTFYDDDEGLIRDKNDALFEKLKNSLDQRVVLYKGIDFNSIMPRLYEIISGRKIDLPGQQLADGSVIKKVINVVSKKFMTTYECDIPPSNIHWVGRVNELKILDQTNYKAYFITGIGGQGKSGLASHFISTIADTDEYDFWDWRDCKEEDNRFITIFISLIERITNGKYKSFQLINESIQGIINLFFKELGERKCVFVFDNIDNYIDLINFYPSRGIKELLEKIITVNHNSKFIFTCRPEINVTNPVTFQIALKDLDIDETKQLFRSVNCSLSDIIKEEIAIKAHQLTNGHPLWLNLVSAQLMKGEESAIGFIEDIKNSKGSDIQNPSTILAVNTLNIVWKSLNQKQEILMRGLSESVVAETEKHLRQIMSSELNDNQFSKAFNAIKKLNLVVIKSAPFSPELYELHPLVKEYIVYKFPKKDRNKYITMFVNFYDQVILLVKKTPDSSAPLSLFQNWTNKIELEINQENYISALSTLHQIGDSIITAGFIEEYQRVATRFFIEVDFNEALTNEFPYFEEQFKNFVISMSELGKFTEAEAFLNKFSKSISFKGMTYISFCHTYAYHNWCKKDFISSIEYSEKALAIINSTNITIGQDVPHTLALALRDTRDDTNIRRALEIFCEGKSEDDIMIELEKEEKQSGSYYGNIGRCFWFLGKSQNALKLMKASFKALLKENYSNSTLNKGFACNWIMELLLSEKRLNDAYFFYRMTQKYWEIVAPVKKQELERDYLTIFKNLTQKTLSNTAWEVEKFCVKFIN